MATTLGKLMVLVGLDASDLNRGFDKASRSVKTFGTDLQRVGMQMTAAVSLPLAGLGAAALKSAAQMEQAQIGFTTLLRSATEAKKHVEELKRFTIQTPFQFEDVMQASRLMQAYGFAAEEVIPKLRTIGDAVSALGGGRDLIERITRSIGEIGTRGKVTGEQLRELSRAGIPALSAIAEKMGVTVAEAQSKVTKGTVDAKTAIDALFDYMERRFGGGMEAQSKTLAGMFSNLKDRITFTLADIGSTLAPLAKNLISQYVEPLLIKVRELVAEFAKLPQPIQNTAVAITGLTVAVPLATVALGLFLQNLVSIPIAIRTIWTVATALSTTLGAGLLGAFRALAPAMTAATTAAQLFSGALTFTGIVLAIEQLGELAYKVYQYRKAKGGLKEAEEDDQAALFKLSVFLRQNGQATSELDLKYSKGLISLQQYREELYRLAQNVKAVYTEQKKLSGEGGKALTSEEIKGAFSRLGLKDVKTEAKETTEAFNLLRNAGLLSTGQLQTGARKVAEALKEVKESALTLQDWAKTQLKIEAPAPDTRELERTYAYWAPPADATSNAMRAGAALAQTTKQVSASLFEMHDAAARAARGLNLVRMAEEEVNKGLHIEEALEAFDYLQIKSSASFSTLRDLAQQAYDAIVTDAKSSWLDQIEAEDRLAAASIAMWRDIANNAVGIERDAANRKIKEWERYQKEIGKILGAIEQQQKRHGVFIRTFWTSFWGEMRSVYHRFTAGLVDIILPFGQKTPKDTAAIAELGIKAGVTGQQLNDLVEILENLALATGTSFSSMVTAATDVFKAFGISAADYASTLEMLFAVSRSTTVGIDDLMNGMTRGAALFRAMGMNARDSAMLIGTLTQSGEDATAIFSALESAMKKLAEQGFVNPSGALADIIRRIKEAGTASEATALAVKYFGAQGQEMARIIRAGKLEVAGLGEVTAATAEDIKGAAEQVKEANKETGKLSLLLQELGRSLVRAFAEASIRGIVETIRQLKIMEGLGHALIKLFTSIWDLLTGIFKKAGDLSGGFNFGMNAVGGGGGIGSTVGSGGGAAASIASGGAGGIIGAVTGIGSMVSGIISNFQQYGMNKSLDLIEHETRYSQIHLLNLLEAAREFWPKLADIHDYLWSQQREFLQNINGMVFDLRNWATAGAPGLAFAGAGASYAGAVVNVGDTFNITVDGAPVSPGYDEALSMFREGARLLRARGVRHTTGIK